MSSKLNKKPKTRKTSKLETRAALIKAATEMFSEKGIDASLDEICAHAGFTRGAFYVHFKNRDELSAEVMGRVGGGVLNTLLGSEDDVPINSINDLVSRFLQALVSGEYPLTKAGGIRPFQLLDACARSDDIRNTYMGHVTNSIDRLGAITKRFQDNGEIRKDVSPEQLAFWMVTLVIGLHTLYDLDMQMDFTTGLQTLMTLIKP